MHGAWRNVPLIRNLPSNSDASMLGQIEGHLDRALLHQVHLRGDVLAVVMTPRRYYLRLLMVHTRFGQVFLTCGIAIVCDIRLSFLLYLDFSHLAVVPIAVVILVAAIVQLVLQ